MTNRFKSYPTKHSHKHHKKTLIFAIATGALLNLTPAAQASPKDMQYRSAQIAAMCQDKEARMMMLHELTNTKERKIEVTKLPNATERRDYRQKPVRINI